MLCKQVLPAFFLAAFAATAAPLPAPITITDPSPGDFNTLQRRRVPSLPQNQEKEKYDAHTSRKDAHVPLRTQGPPSEDGMPPTRSNTPVDDAGGSGDVPSLERRKNDAEKDKVKQQEQQRQAAQLAQREAAQRAQREAAQRAREEDARPETSQFPDDGHGPAWWDLH